MKNNLRLLSGYAQLRSQSFTGRHRLRQISWLIIILTSLSTLGWGQCFNTTTVPVANPITLPVGTNPASVVVGDFNGDSKPDLVTANYGSANVSVVLGNGSGVFGGATNFSAGINPVSVGVGDFNGDGKTDLVTANSGSNNVSVLLGNGSG
jgi:hypothetical protein